MDVLLEIAVEILPLYVLGALGLFVVGRLLGVKIPLPRLLLLALVTLLTLGIGGFGVKWMVSLERLPMGLLAMVARAAILAGAIVLATRASVARAAAIALLTDLARTLVMILAEAVLAAYLYGSAT